MRSVRSWLMHRPPGGGAGARRARRARSAARCRRPPRWGSAPRPGRRRRGRTSSSDVPRRAARVLLVGGDLLVELAAPRVDVALVLVVAAPPLVRPALRHALGRVL